MQLSKLSEISNDVKRALVFRVEVLQDTRDFNGINTAQCRLTDVEGKSSVFTINFGGQTETKGTKGIGYFTEYQRYVYENGQKTDRKNGKGLFVSYIDTEEEAE